MKNSNPTPKKKKFVFWLLLFLAFVFLLWFLRTCRQPDRVTADLDLLPPARPQLDTTLPDSQPNIVPKKNLSPLRHAEPETLEIDSPETNSADFDTIPPVVRASPTGGLYFKAIAVTLSANEPATIFYLKSPNAIPALIDSNVNTIYQTPLHFSERVYLYFYAKDSAGNQSPIKKRRYMVNNRIKSPCLADMIYVYFKDQKYCIDEFEWPNRKNRKPQNFISWQEASDSCKAVGKRLCTAMEWENACSDFGNDPYPYGNDYEKLGCVTQLDGPQKSGRFKECRSYFGAYDLSGNLQEWTSTRAPKNNRFFKVMAGYWASHSNSRCGDYKYSFYPQNRSVTVGFRCCASP